MRGNSDHHVLEAQPSLLEERAMPLSAMISLPTTAGLYAIHAPPRVWEELRLVPQDRGTPLYVGKAETQTIGQRVEGEHLRSKRKSMMSSTLRRSLAALLAAKLRLLNCKEATEEQEATLTEWMRSCLSVAAWPFSRILTLAELKDQLETEEDRVLESWKPRPPLNLDRYPKTDNNAEVLRVRALFS